MARAQKFGARKPPTRVKRLAVTAIASPRTKRSEDAAFTLIELLVIVAIIALLLTILLPALGRARAQARTVLCASRVSQMTKAMLIYAGDYDDAPPFIITDPANDDPKVDGGRNRRKETWLAAAATMQRIYLMKEEGWYGNDDPPLPQSGDLFSYARFPDVYRCPEFERVSSEHKWQNAFNITRSIFGNKANRDEIGQFNRGLLKLSQVYASAELPMMVDESWFCSVAYPIDGDWVWGGIDPMWDAMNTCLGQYHGPPIRGYAWYPDSPPQGSEAGVVADDPQKSATTGYYDGHVGLTRDPVPNVQINHLGRAPLNLASDYGRAYVTWILKIAYAQLGIPAG